jgi:hypothetical protein
VALLVEALSEHFGQTGIRGYNDRPRQYAGLLLNVERGGLPEASKVKARQLQIRSIIGEGQGNGLLPSVILSHLERLGCSKAEVLPLLQKSFQKPEDPDDDDAGADWQRISQDLAQIG